MFSLTPFNSIFDLIKTFPDEQSCINHLEWLIWNGDVVSPFDKDSTVYKCSKNRYRCKNTGKYFNVRIGTIFEGTKIGLQSWFMAIYLFSSHKKGISSYQLAKDLNITQKTAWFMLHRIRYAMDHETFKREMEGVVEADETFVGGKNKNRHADKKVKNSQGRSFKDKTPVIGLLDRDNKTVRCFVAEDTSSDSLHPVLKSNVARDSTLISDEWRGYRGLTDYYNHQIVDHSRKEYVNDVGGTTNGIENFWTHFKRGWSSTYSGRITKKHLQKYADEFTFRYNTKDLSVSNRFNLFLSGVNEKRLTYKNLVNEL